MKTSSAKAKGRNLQKLVVSKVLEAFPELEPDDVRSTPMGVTGADVQLSPLAQSTLGVQFECKARNVKTFPVYDYYEQAKEHGKHEPVVVLKGDRKKPLAVVDLEFLLELLVDRLDEKDWPPRKPSRFDDLFSSSPEELKEALLKDLMSMGQLIDRFEDKEEIP